MKPMFTLHIGEYLLGDHIQRTYPRWSVWVPAKDTGIDLLVTGEKNRKSVSIQVKFSKDFTRHGSRLLAAGWWTYDPKKMQESSADLWVLVLPSFIQKQTSFVILPPAELLRRLRAIHRSSSGRIQSYLWVTKSQRCWETRGLAAEKRDVIALDQYSNTDRDFTVFLNAWGQIERQLR